MRPLISRMTMTNELFVTVTWTNCGGGEVKFLAMKRDCTKTQPRGERGRRMTQRHKPKLCFVPCSSNNEKRTNDANISILNIFHLCRWFIKMHTVSRVCFLQALSLRHFRVFFSQSVSFPLSLFSPGNIIVLVR